MSSYKPCCKCKKIYPMSGSSAGWWIIGILNDYMLRTFQKTSVCPDCLLEVAKAIYNMGASEYGRQAWVKTSEAYDICINRLPGGAQVKYVAIGLPDGIACFSADFFDRHRPEFLCDENLTPLEQN